MPLKKHSLPLYSPLGGLLILTAYPCLFLKIEPFYTWFTPIVWWGYIFLVDGIVFRLSGTSYLMKRRGEFLVLLPASVLCWLLFEFYNIYLEAWHYIGLYPSMWIRYTGYAITYATIFPAIFETAEFLECTGLFQGVRDIRVKTEPMTKRICLIAGGLMVAVPLIFPLKELIPLVWMGYTLLLDPINERNNGRSLLRLLDKGRGDSVLSLLLAGLVCGLLWEFWNYWAGAKWVYTFPYTETLRYFEMPVLGLLGFPAFALECYAMTSTILLTLGREGSPRRDEMVILYTFIAIVLLFPLIRYGNEPPAFARHGEPVAESIQINKASVDRNKSLETLRIGTVETRLQAVDELASLDTSDAMRLLSPYLKDEIQLIRERVAWQFREWSRRHRFEHR